MKKILFISAFGILTLAGAFLSLSCQATASSPTFQSVLATITPTP